MKHTWKLNYLPSIDVCVPTNLGRSEAQLEPLFQHRAPCLELSPLIFELVDAIHHGDHTSPEISDEEQV